MSVGLSCLSVCLIWEWKEIRIFPCGAIRWMSNSPAWEKGVGAMQEGEGWEVWVMKEDAERRCWAYLPSSFLSLREGGCSSSLAHGNSLSEKWKGAKTSTLVSISGLSSWFSTKMGESESCRLCFPCFVHNAMSQPWVWSPPEFHCPAGWKGCVKSVGNRHWRCYCCKFICPLANEVILSHPAWWWWSSTSIAQQRLLLVVEFCEMFRGKVV